MIYSLLASGRKAVLQMCNPADVDRVANWVNDAVSLEQPELSADLIFQTRNKRRAVENCCPILSKLSLICVDEVGRDALQKLDPMGKFLRIVVGSEAFFLFRSASSVDPVVSGWVETPDGRRRLRAPIFRSDADLPPIFQLPSIYEAAGETMCGDFAVRELRDSGLTGLCVWNYQSRQEELL